MSEKPMLHGLLSLRQGRPQDSVSTTAQSSAAPSTYNSDDESSRAPSERRLPFRVVSVRNGNLNVRYMDSLSNSVATTPQSSAYPSRYPSDDEDEEDKEELAAKSRKARAPFTFLELPSELRTKIYSYIFGKVPRVLDLDPDNFRNVHRTIMPLFLVNKQIHNEASHHFYSTHAFRVFPCHPGRFFKTKKPLLARLSPRCRASLSSLELRLGPGWSAPPRGWIVNDALGLKDCVNVRVLHVFVEVDPSHAIFKGFRKADGFYEGFSKRLLTGILDEVPSVVETQFDAWSQIKRDGNMLQGLLQVAADHRKLISWGSERDWTEEELNSWDDFLLAQQPGASILSRSVAVRA